MYGDISNCEQSSVSVYLWRMKTSGSIHVVQSQQEKEVARQNTESLDSFNLDKTQGEEKPATSIHKASSFQGMSVLRESVLPREVRCRLKITSLLYGLTVCLKQPQNSLF